MILTLLILLTLNPASDSTAWHLWEKADSLYRNERFGEAVSTAAEAGALFRKDGDKEGQAEALSTEATAWFRLGAYDKAMERQEACYQLDRESGDSSRISSSLNTLAAICVVAGDYDRAAEYNRQTLQYELRQGPSERLAIRYGMAADIAVKAGNPAAAADYARKALAVDREAGREVAAAIRLSQLANALAEMDRQREAKACLDEAIAVFEAHDIEHSLSIALAQRSALLMDANHPAEAAEDARRAYRLSEGLGNKLVMRNAARLAGEALSVSAPKEASDYFEKALDLTEEISRDDMARHVADFNARYDLTAKEHDIQIKEQALHARSIQAWLLLGIVLLLGGSLLGLCIVLRRRSRTNAALMRASMLKDQLLALQPSLAEKEPMKDISKELDSLGASPSVHLSSRELEVARFCCDGLTAKEIAQRLQISVRTVETHKNNIFRKLGITTTVDLVRLMGKIQ